MNEPGHDPETVNAVSIDAENDEDLVYGRLAEEINALLHDGHDLNDDALVAEHPEHATQIRQLVPALQALQQLGHNADASAL